MHIVVRKPVDSIFYEASFNGGDFVTLAIAIENKIKTVVKVLQITYADQKTLTISFQ